MDWTTCFEVLSLGYRCQDAQLYAVAWEYCMEHFDVAVAKGAPALQSLPLTVLHSVLSSDVIQVQTELSIFEAMTRWVAGDTEKREHLLPQLLQTVRLHLLTIDELSDHVEAHELVKVIGHGLVCNLSLYRNPRVNVYIGQGVKRDPEWVLLTRELDCYNSLHTFTKHVQVRPALRAADCVSTAEKPKTPTISFDCHTGTLHVTLLSPIIVIFSCLLCRQMTSRQFNQCTDCNRLCTSDPRSLDHPRGGTIKRTDTFNAS
eukprot:9499661-Pyramimonas_sp.AAC.2